jgi:hypothetical protein
MKAKNLTPTLMLVTAVLLLAACIAPSSAAGPNASGTMEGTDFNIDNRSFKLYILQQRLPITCYKLEKCWPLLRQANLKDSDFVISQDDIEAYNWSNQTITLTSGATNRLSVTFSGNPASLGFDRTAFVATLDGERLYGGIFLDLSAQPYSFPLIFTDFSGTQAVFYLRPAAPRQPMQDYQQYDAVQRELIEIGKVHDFFKGLRKLTE